MQRCAVFLNHRKKETNKNTSIKNTGAVPAKGVGGGVWAQSNVSQTLLFCCESNQTPMLRENKFPILQF